MREWAGVVPETGKPLWVRWEDENGKLLHGSNRIEPTKVTTTSTYSEASRIPIESSYPDFTGGFSNDLMFKNFMLTILTNFAVGNKVYSSANYSVHDFMSNRLKITKWHHLTVWEKPGDIADVSQLIFGDPYSSREESTIHLWDASYLKFQSVRLGYTFPKSIFVIKNLNVSAIFENLGIITRYPYGDSDTSFESPSASIHRYRPTRKILFSISFDI